MCSEVRGRYVFTREEGYAICLWHRRGRAPPLRVGQPPAGPHNRGNGVCRMASVTARKEARRSEGVDLRVARGVARQKSP